MKASELPVSGDYDLWMWANVLDLGDESPSKYSSVEVMQSMTEVVTQEERGSISLDRMKRVDAFHVGSPEGYASTEVFALVELVDGWGTLVAWCDTTGWDCQSGGQWKWAATREEAIRNGLGTEERARLELSLPEDGSS